MSLTKKSSAPSAGREAELQINDDQNQNQPEIKPLQTGQFGRCMKINAGSFIINNFRNVFSSHHQPTPVNDPLMEPPSYEDACFQPQPSVARTSDIPPPPSYDDSSLPSPPTYREAGRADSY